MKACKKIISFHCYNRSTQKQETINTSKHKCKIKLLKAIYLNGCKLDLHYHNVKARLNVSTQRLFRQQEMIIKTSQQWLNLLKLISIYLPNYELIDEATMEKQGNRKKAHLRNYSNVSLSLHILKVLQFHSLIKNDLASHSC
jgi:hypothetical protein